MNAFNHTGYLKWLFKHRKPLIAVQVLAILASVIFSSPAFIPPLFKSTAVVYPYNLSTYSRETSTEQMLEFLNSTDIKMGVINRFNLTKHYKIDTTSEKDWKTELLEKYDKNVNISATEYEAVEVSAFDINPDTAYKIVNGVLDVLNQKVLGVQKEKSVEVAKIWKKLLDNKKKECDSLSGLSKSLSTEYGLLDYGNQTREVTRAYYQSSKNADVSAAMKNMEEKGMELNAVNQHLNSALTNYDDILVKYEDAMKDVNKQLTYSNMVTTPFVADKKSYPVRWLILVIACASSFLFSVLAIRVLEKL
jgi:uncharacterized protein involved in exopolysaccharide biosynthesis